ncbi:MAG: hypothetical protein R3A78_09170 [Polyangiales bacterium]|nr:hypothetical protein [Myxococcales bacterium]
MNAGPVVEWFRVDSSKAREGILAWGALIVLAGSLVAGLGFAELSLEGPVRVLCISAGLLVVAAGPLWAIRGLTRVIGEDGFIALCRDALLIDLPSCHATIPWTALEEVQTLGPDELRLRTDAGEEHRIQGTFAGLGPATLESKLLEARRKALFGLYKPKR